MKTIRVIVEHSGSWRKDEKICALGEIKYDLPIINACVLEIPENALEKLKNIDTVIAVHHTTKIAAQMYTERQTVNVNAAYEQGLSGRGVGIAFLDTGICPVADLVLPEDRIVAFKDVVAGKTTPYDDNGHGTHVAGIAAGNGLRSNGMYMGIAPECDIIGVKILSRDGQGNSADVLSGVQWVLDNKQRYNIRIANLSVGTAGQTAKNDPLVKAVEALWDNGIVVVAAAGNNGPDAGTITSPGVSRKIITVGAADDSRSVEIWGDDLVDFSGRGPTPDCIIKPDILAPGANIVSLLSIQRAPNQKLRIVDKYYLELSGTSMATPMVSGAIALLLEKYPYLTPNEIKYMLKLSSTDLGHPQNHQGWGLLDIEKLIDMEERL